MKLTDQKDTLQAVALRYDTREDSAPRVTAKGSGYVAEKIIEAARIHGVPIHQDRNLVQILSFLELQQEIPQQIYCAVAEILCFLYQTNGNSGRHPDDS